MFSKLAWAQLHIYKKIAKQTQKTQHLLNVLVSSVLYGISADDVPAVIFALLIVYSGQIPLFVSNATSFLYRWRDAVCWKRKANFVKILSAPLQNGYLNVYIFGD